jgi:hypothetical protein
MKNVLKNMQISKFIISIKYLESKNPEELFEIIRKVDKGK